MGSGRVTRHGRGAVKQSGQFERDQDVSADIFEQRYGDPDKYKPQESGIRRLYPSRDPVGKTTASNASIAASDGAKAVKGRMLEPPLNRGGGAIVASGHTHGDAKTGIKRLT